MAPIAGQFSTFVDVLQYWADRQGEKVVFAFLGDGEEESDRLTYGDLDRRARAIGEGLQAQGAQGERALLLYPPGLAFIEAFFGCLYAGVIAVPAYPPRANRSLERLEAIVNDAAARFVLTTGDRREQMEPHFPQAITLATDEMRGDGDWQRPAIHPQDLAFLQYTSGSTGDPKGVMVSHGNLIANSEVIRQGFGNTRDSRGVSWLPPYHDMGLIGGILQPVYVGAFQVLLAPVSFLQRPIRWLKAISDYRVTTSGGPNFAYDLCAQQLTPEQIAGLDLRSWTLAFTGAEPVRSATLERFAHTFAPCGFDPQAFYPCYGMAETTLMVTGRHGGDYFHGDRQALLDHRLVPQKDPAQRLTLTSCGPAVGEMQWAIVDPESLQPCGDLEIGEIWVKGPSVAQGYWGKTDLTAATFHAPLKGEIGWLRTGDLGFGRSGELYITGRRKDLIIIRGRNYYPQDLEETMVQAHPALKPGAGAAVSGEWDGEERLILVQEVQRSALRRLNGEEVTGAIRRAIVQEYQIAPDHIVLIKTGSIPKTSSGKIRRFACWQGFWQGGLEVVALGDRPEAAAIPPAPPFPQVSSLHQDIQGELQKRIAQRLHLAPAEIDPEAPFASYGLDSVQAVQLTAELEDWLGQRLNPTLAYDYPTIASLAGFLAQLSQGSPQPAAAPLGEPTPTTGAIAVVGLACRFPGGESLGEFWQLLRGGSSAIQSLESRWGTPGAAGLLRQITDFDAAFFGLSPREAERMDPQQRLLLEVTWECFEQAQIAPDRLRGSNTGVFVGISSSDYAQWQARQGIAADAYSGTGNAHSIAANRLSYLFDLRGPSLAVDTACSSSLVALHLAAESLRRGECDRAIVGGVNLLLSPELSDTFQQAGMLSPQGQCRTFDAAADGYVRGEGCGVLLLKPLAQAQQDGDPIWGVLAGTAINQDGRSNGLTAPNGLAQQAVIRQALQRAGLQPDQIAYVEAHGTGTPLGDPIEVGALQQVLGDRPGGRWLGSVKTNIGHLEAAAGIAGVIKVLLALRYGEIPPHLYWQESNPHIRLGDHWAIPTQGQPWPKGPRWAGVSSFGFGGTNAHAILGEGPSLPAPAPPEETPLSLIPFSAKTAAALEAQIAAYAGMGDLPLATLAQIQQRGRQHFRDRRAFVAASVAELHQQIAAGLNPTTPPLGKIAFLFTGQGSQFPRMGLTWYGRSAVFRAALDRCAPILDPLLPQPMMAVLQSGDETLLAQTQYTQPLLFAVEYALAQQWLHWGLKPDLLLGHSVGEYVAACIAGVFSLEDALTLIAARGRLMQQLPDSGGMVAIFASVDQVKEILAPDTVIAAYNGVHQVVSGRSPAITRVMDRAQGLGWKIRPLQVSHAFHSPLLRPMVADFAQIARSITYHPPQWPVLSNLTGEAMAEMGADYWIEHLCAPVRFAQSLERAAQRGITTWLEVGPKPVMIGMAQSWLPGAEHLWLSSWQPQIAEDRSLYETLARLYEGGWSPPWDRLFPATLPRTPQVFPPYPFQRQTLWTGPLPGPQTAAPLGQGYQTLWRSVDRTLTPAKGDRGKTYVITGEDPAPWIAELCTQLGAELLPPSPGERFPTTLDRLIAIAPASGDPAGELAFLTDRLLPWLQWLIPQAPGAKLWLLTEQCQTVTTEDRPQPWGSSLWGLGRTIALEHPELWGGLVDLSHPHLPRLLALLTQADFGQTWAIRGDRLYQPLLEAQPLPSAAAIAVTGTYLITGAFGALGWQQCQWLLQQGARSLLLWGRKDPTPAQADQIAQWRSQGVAIAVTTVDVTQSQAIAQALQGFYAQGGQLRGVIHCAGVLQDRLLMHQSAEDFRRVFTVKAAAAWTLHHLTQDQPLEQFILFSSLASLTGSPGQGNYAAANGFLDGLARHRQGLGLPVLAIHWGPWQGAGMAQRAEMVQRLFPAIAPAQGWASVARLWSVGGSWGLFTCDGVALGQQFPQLRGDPFFQSLLPAIAPTAAPAIRISPLGEQLRSRLPEERPSLLEGYLHRTLADILKLSPDQLSPEENLLDSGLDSLMVMEAIAQLRQDLDLMLYPREIYERPKVRSLAAYLAQEWTKTHGGGTVTTSEQIPETAPALAPRRPPLTVEKKSDRPMVFILSSPRSGSTLLRVMLAGHPQLYSPPELHLLPFNDLADRQGELGLSYLGEGLQRAIMDLLYLDASESQAQLQSWQAAGWTIPQVYAHLQGLAGDRILIDKSPSYASQRDTLDRAEQIFSRAKYIHLVRHPYAVLESFCRLRMDKLVGQGGEDPFSLAETIWHQSNQNTLDFFATLPADRHFTLRYEDLVRDPAAAMEAVCAFLAIPFDAALLDPYQGDRLTDGVQAGSLGVGDPNFLQRRAIDPSLADQWQKITLPRPLGPASQGLARQLSYDLPQPLVVMGEPVAMEETFVHIRGLNLCLCGWGPSDAPPVLCLHGILEQGAIWSEVAQTLVARGYRVIAPDLRGHGRSDHLPKGGAYHLLDFLGDLDALVAHLQPQDDRPLTLVGHSLGSVIAALFASVRPQKLQRLILVEPVLPSEENPDTAAEQLATHLDYLAHPPEHPLFPDLATAGDRLRLGTPGLPDRLVEFLTQRIVEPQGEGWRWRWAPLLRTRAGLDFNGIDRQKYLNLLQRLAVPTTLIYGDRSTFNRPQDLADQAQVFTQAQRFTIPGGHHLPLENPVAVAEAIGGKG